MRGQIAPHNLALLKFILQHQPICTFDAFSVFKDAGESVKAFGHRLAYLKLQGWLANAGSTRSSVWSTTEEAVELIEQGLCQRRAKTAITEEPRWQGAIVPPRQFDVLNSPLYRPVAVSYRNGAFDHTAYPSINMGRAVPFKAASEVNHG
jgi:hypothetical protein